jgi:hypothetical protein
MLGNGGGNTQPFKSKTKKQEERNSLTQSVDYGGQKFGTIEQRLSGIAEKSKEIKRHATGTVANWTMKANANDPKFGRKIKTEVEVRDHLVETMYGYRQRDPTTEKKGFTFNQSQRILVSNDAASALSWYNLERNWIKQSFNVKWIKKNKEE